MVRVIGICILVFFSNVGFSTKFYAVRGAVHANQTYLFQFKTSKDGFSPSQRAAQIVAKLRSLKSAQPVAVEYKGGQAKVLVGKLPMVRVTPEEAGAHHKSVKQLALLWKTRLRNALGFLSAPSRIQKESKTSEQIPLQNISHLSYFNPQHKRDGLPALNPELGKEKVNQTQVIEVEVSGSPASAKTIERVIQRGVKAKVNSNLVSKIEIQTEKIYSLEQGGSFRYQPKVRVVPFTRQPVEGVLDVFVRNRVLPFKKEQLLWYSNDPENVKKVGLLGAAELNAGLPIRALAHHINASAYPLVVQVLARNPSNQVAKVAVLGGDGKPHTDPVRVGLEAGQKFLQSWMSRDSEIVEIPPGHMVPIFHRRLAPKETMSGLVRLELLPGGPEKLTLSSESSTPNYPLIMPVMLASRAAPSAALLRTTAIWPSKDYMSQHLYENPLKTIKASYEHGKKFEFIQVGANPIESLDGKRKLEGNFGVTYQIQTSIKNPTQESAEIEVVFEASAGYSGAVFLVNGQSLQIPLLQSKKEFLLARMKLSPGTAKNLDLMTIPLGGSSYPAMITIRPRGGGK